MFTVFFLCDSAQELSRVFGNDDERLVEKVKCKKLKIHLENGTQCEVLEYKAFWCKKQCYVWDTTQAAFSRLVGLDKYTLCSDLHLNSNQGLSNEEQCLRYRTYLFRVFFFELALSKGA